MLAGFHDRKTGIPRGTMPQHKSNEKRMRTSKKENARNRAVKSALKTLAKKVVAAAPADAESAFREAASELDRAAKKGIIPRRRADRRKSRLARAVNRARAAA
jgi:small subunit ribosomal protein S20